MAPIRPVKTQVTWMRARDLAPPESVSLGGSVTGVSGPVVDVLFLMVVSVFGAVGAVYALTRLSIPGFLIMGIFAAVPAYMGWVRYQQASAPAVSVGAGGVWLAGTDRRAGQAIPWSNVDELVFFTALERRVNVIRTDRHHALGVRLRVPARLPAEERAQLDQLMAGLPDIRDQVMASVDSWEKMPYRQIGAAGRLERSALAKATAGFAPSVRVVKGPRLTSLTPWVVGAADTQPPAVLQPMVTGGPLPALLGVLRATPRGTGPSPPDRPGTPD